MGQTEAAEALGRTVGCSTEGLPALEPSGLWWRGSFDSQVPAGGWPVKKGGTQELPVWKAEAEQGDLCSGELDDLLVGSHLLAGQLAAVSRGGRTGC